MTRFAIISDIHGCLPALDQTLSHLQDFEPDYYLLLGDLLNHGPRNPIPDGYAPAEVAACLNRLREQLIAVRGNCDSEVDQMLLHFPCLAPYNFLIEGNRRFCMTHGHLYPLEQLGLRRGDILLSGHTHQAAIEEVGPGLLSINPGSVTFPRQNGIASYALYADGLFSIHAVQDGSVLMQHRLGAE